jgi:selenocysteine lyase/cysteine desulfurase
VSFRKPGTNSAATVARLRQHKIATAERAGWIRTSPHFYITPDEIDRVVDLF